MAIEKGERDPLSLFGPAIVRDLPIHGGHVRTARSTSKPNFID